MKQNVKYLECRDWGHAWTADTVTKIATRYVVTLRCTRCKTRRSRSISKQGELLRHNVYKYPKGYLAPAGTKVNREQNREALLRILLGDKA